MPFFHFNRTGKYQTSDYGKQYINLLTRASFRGERWKKKVPYVPTVCTGPAG